LDEITTYELLVFGHILAVVAWVGANITIQVLAHLARRAGGQRMMDLLGDVAWMGTHYFIPVSLIVVALGFGVISESNGAYELSQFWVSAGLAMFLISFATGAGFLGPESERIFKLSAERTPDDPEVQRRAARLFLVARIELILLIAVVFDMVVKPGL
jgi:low temperature requirement protein LtrA